MQIKTEKVLENNSLMITNDLLLWMRVTAEKTTNFISGQTPLLVQNLLHF